MSPSTTTEPIIRFIGVRKSFGPKRIYVDLNLDIYPKESLTIIGGSGVGKSVMLKMLIGLLRPDAGQILFHGQDISRLKEHELTKVRQRIAMLFQGAALFDSISVGENVAYGLREHFRKTMTEEQIRERVAWALGLVGLPGIEDMRPADLSGGMKKRAVVFSGIREEPDACRPINRFFGYFVSTQLF
jgi:phospholipid/cholesterol/gamma-HCH transport system ATP-binding protein